MGHKQTGPVQMTLEQFADAMMHKFHSQFAGMNGEVVAGILAKAATECERLGQIIITNKPEGN